MRGKYYLWTGGDCKSEKNNRLHIWVADGGESRHEDTGWSESWKEADSLMGCSIPEKVIDMFVVMRYAELEAEKKVEKTVEKAINEYGGNFGCIELCKKYGKPTALDDLEEYSKKLEKKKKGKKVCK